MNNKCIALIGTFDTKLEVLLFMKQQIEQRNCKAILFDVSPIVYSPRTKHDSNFNADITPRDICRMLGENIDEIKSSKDRERVNRIMEEGTIEKLRQLYSSGGLDGVVAIGGLTNTLFASHIFKTLPFGVSKLIVCSGVRQDVMKWFGLSDIAVMQVLVDMERLNELVKNVLVRAAGAICGMVDKATVPIAKLDEKSIALTEYGFCDNCAVLVSSQLENRGYSVYPFHAMGVGDAAMDALITQGYFNGVIDIVTGGVIEEIFQGTRAAGPKRLEAAGERGLPQVIAPSGINLTNAGPERKHNEKYSSREKKIKLDEFRIITRYNMEELTAAAKVYAEKLNKARGPVKFLIPLRGWSSADKKGSVLYSPDEDRAFAEELKKRLRPEIEIRELDCNLDDPEFAEALVESFIQIYEKITN
jgi:uncharacterized protein (UPF0261 family)